MPVAEVDGGFSVLMLVPERPVRWQHSLGRQHDQVGTCLLLLLLKARQGQLPWLVVEVVLPLLQPVEDHR